MHKPQYSTDYATYKEILSDLLLPINGQDLDHDTLRRLYESKLVYLDNLRKKCFKIMNQRMFVPVQTANFAVQDYEIIVEAIRETQGHLSAHFRNVIHMNLEKIVKSA